MSDEDVLREAIEGMIDEEVSDGEDSGDLPRIVVEDDKILVFEENYWAERNVLKALGETEEEEKGVEEDLSLVEGSEESSEEVLNEVLEEILGGSVKIEDGESSAFVAGDFYKVSKGGQEFYESEFYDAGVYDESSGDDYEISVEDFDVKNSATVADELRGGRSALEIAGFKDSEAEKRRGEKREGNFI